MAYHGVFYAALITFQSGIHHAGQINSSTKSVKNARALFFTASIQHLALVVKVSNYPQSINAADYLHAICCSQLVFWNYKCDHWPQSTGKHGIGYTQQTL